MSLDESYYSLALSCGKERNLSGAAVFARQALCLNGENEKARRLLGLCLYELGDLEGAADVFAGMPEWESVCAERECANEAFSKIRELAARKKWRKAESEARKIRHQSARVLKIRGCLLVASKRRGKASALFAQALEKDRGGQVIFLTETTKQRGWRQRWK